jgi:hypothetical protein
MPRRGGAAPSEAEALAAAAPGDPADGAAVAAALAAAMRASRKAGGAVTVPEREWNALRGAVRDATAQVRRPPSPAAAGAGLVPMPSRAAVLAKGDPRGDGIDWSEVVSAFDFAQARAVREGDRFLVPQMTWTSLVTAIGDVTKRTHALPRAARSRLPREAPEAEPPPAGPGGP